VIGRTAASRFRVALGGEFADHDSLEKSVRDYAWLISTGEPHRSAWTRYQTDQNATALIAGIARAYSTAPSYAVLVTGIAAHSNVTEAIDAARRP
jgi:flagellum-specific peptidoglycan hydrolase FlgJ